MRFIRYMACISYLGAILPTFHLYAPPAEDISLTINIRLGTLIGMTTGFAMGAYRQHQLNKKSKGSRPRPRSLENLNLLIGGFNGAILGSNFKVATLEDAGKVSTSTVGTLWLAERLADYPKIVWALLLAPIVYRLGRAAAARR